MMQATYTFPVALEEGAGGAALAHALTLPGCLAEGRDREEALAELPEILADWLHFLGGRGEEIPAAGCELELTVDEWVAVDADLAGGAGHALFAADEVPLDAAEIDRSLQRLGDLRGPLLRRLRQLRQEDLDRVEVGELTARRIADELARAQWWTLTRLGASPLAEVPERTLARLDTAMALVVQRFTEPAARVASAPVELEGELWTPRKVLRRLLWLEWTLGGNLLRLLTPTEVAP